MSTQIKERPIIFSGEMIRAILDNRKTQTRRVIKHQPTVEQDRIGEGSVFSVEIEPGIYDMLGKKNLAERCPYGKPGDRLWVRETWDFRPMAARSAIVGYKADNSTKGISVPDGWNGKVYDNRSRARPSIHMPRWASRILLEIVDIRVGRVQDISRDDAKAEGTPLPPDTLYPLVNTSDKQLKSFPRLWDSINKKCGYGWDVNPWVFVIQFRRIK